MQFKDLRESDAGTHNPCVEGSSPSRPIIYKGFSAKKKQTCQIKWHLPNIQWFLVVIILSGFCPVQADTFTYSGDKLRDSLSIRDQQSMARFPRPLCRTRLYDVTAGTTLVVQGWGNVTNDSRIDNVGFTCEIHLCDPQCTYGNESSRFDKMGGIAQGGGSNVNRQMHHAAISRYGRINLLDHRAALSVELQCRAYNKQGKGEKLTVDGCGLDVREVQ